MGYWSIAIRLGFAAYVSFGLVLQTIVDSVVFSRVDVTMEVETPVTLVPRVDFGTLFGISHASIPNSIFGS